MHARVFPWHRLRVRPLVLDRVLAAVLTVSAQLEIWLGTQAGPHRVVVAVIVPVITLSIAVRRRYPALVGVLAVVLSAADSGIWGSPQIVSYPIAYFCALYALTAWTPTRRFVVGTVLVAAMDLLSSAGPQGTLKGAVPFTVVTVVVMVLLRVVLGDRERRVRLAERERDVAAREAVVEERARIARELHDVIAHHVSMIVMQAGAERRVLEDGPGTTRGVLQTIEDTGRSALTEMRRLLGMLRAEEGEPLAPQPRLEDLSTLVRQLGEAGLPVDLSFEGERRPLPVGVELSGYRIVQEALTNTLKHGGDARATVLVRYAPAALELEVADDGVGVDGRRDSNGGGHGLVGMRERAALCGGRLEAGRRTGGGYAVRAVLPLP